MGIPFTILMGFLLTIVLGIQFTISISSGKSCTRSAALVNRGVEIVKERVTGPEIGMLRGMA